MSVRDLLREPTTVWDIVLGAGGIKGFAHSGFLQCIQDRKLRVGTVYGVSIGSTCAALYTNGYSPVDINRILTEEIGFIDKEELTRFIRRPHLGKLWQEGGFYDLFGLLSRLVQKYELKPNSALSIVAYAPKLHKPVVFRGTDYDLAGALASSCAMPLFMRSQHVPMEGKLQWLVDGGLYNANPDEFCCRPTIVSKLGLAHSLPVGKLSWPDWLIHMSELIYAPFFEAWRRRQYKQSTVLVETGMKNVATMTFDLNPELCSKMAGHAYEQTSQVLNRLTQL
ncbi:MAG: patatin-like phospholipase family protein [Candidatus Obscuribacterales bacterium]|nr:patatin-like phospholipase family protein [Candidatus Obscuribacterales bacterium]